MAAFERLKEVKSLLEADSQGDSVAHRRLLEAVHKLQLEVEIPHDTATRLRFQPLQNIAVRIALEYGLLQAVAKREGKPISATDLSKETAADEVITERLMRMICWIGYCDEVGENMYQANGTTMHVCTPGMIGGEKHHTEVILPIGGKMVEMMRVQGFHPYGENGYKDPMEYTHGYRFFEFFAANDEHKQAFDDYMAARRSGTQLQWFDIYPAKSFIDENPLKSAKDVLVCDVGGGQGHEIVKFKESFPDEVGRLVLQDLARSFQGIDLPAGIEAIPHDFFQPQPIKEARIYYMRQIMHDWTDDECRKILSHTVEAMDKDSRLLIDDYVMPPTGAEFRTIHMDICMMMYMRSEERTKRRWESLLSSAGLEIVHIWTPPTAFESIIETRLR